MNLDELLGSMSIEQLQDLAAVWAPEAAPSSSKLALFRTIRAQMTRPDRVRHCLELADDFGRGVIRRLLRSSGVSHSLAVLAASSAARPRSLDEARAAVNELAGLGLVCVQPEKRWETFGSARVSIADELVEPLRQVTGIDERSPDEIFALAGHLAAMAERDLARLIKKFRLSGDTATPAETLTEQLAAPAACVERLNALSPDLRKIVLSILHQRAGIVPVSRLHKDLGLELPEIRNASLAAWRKELEANLVGTVGDVSLLEYGIDLDGKVLVLFTEVVESLLSTAPDTAPQIEDTVGPDFVLDLAELLSAVRESGVRLKASGALTGPAAQRIITRLNRPELPLMNAHDLLELRVICAEKLGLIERSDDFLTLRQAAWQWESRSCEEKAADLFALLGSAVPAPRSKHHHDALCEIARTLLRSMKPGEWRPGGSVTGITIRRYLTGLKASGLREQIAHAVEQVSKYVLPPFPSLRQLASDIRESVVMEAYAMGILDLAPADGAIAWLRLGDFGAVATGQAPAKLPPAKLIATPDFEVILLPEGDTTRLRYELGQFTAREKFEKTCHLRITKDRVEEAVVRGIEADDMIGVLREHAHAAVPQNVEYSIRGWAGRIRVATVEHVYLLELPDEQLLDVVVELPELKPIILRRVSPTVLALSEPPADRKLLADLRSLGIYVR